MFDYEVLDGTGQKVLHPYYSEHLQRSGASKMNMLSYEALDGTRKVLSVCLLMPPKVPPFWSLERRNWLFLAHVASFLIGLLTLLLLSPAWDASSIWMGPPSVWELLFRVLFELPQSGWTSFNRNYTKSLVGGKYYVLLQRLPSSFANLLAILYRILRLLEGAGLSSLMFSVLGV